MGVILATVILPDADLKFYIDADVEVRAKRRYLELSAKDEHVTQAQILADLIERDARDKDARYSAFNDCRRCSIIIDSHK